MKPLFLLMVLSIQLVSAQPCPSFGLGQGAILHSGDVFDGRSVQVFQPGWTDGGAAVYVVKTLTPPLAHLGATGCQLEVQSIQPTQRSIPVMNAQQQMLYTLYSLTLGQSGIYGNAIGIPGGSPNDTAQANINAGWMRYDNQQYWITEAGISELQRIGAIE